MTTTKQNFAAAARQLEQWGRDMDKPIASGLRLIGEEVATDARSSRPGKGVPRDEGVLAASIQVLQPKPNLVQVVAGGPAAPYALVQHERLDYHHKLGEARYLVRALERWRPDGSAAVTALQEMADAAIRKVAARGKSRRHK